MAQTNGIPQIWKLIDEALSLEGASKIHLAAGRPPLVRIDGMGLQPFPQEKPVLTWETIQLMLSLVVEPERWDQLEKDGEGEIRLSTGSGRPIAMALFRSAGAWSAVIHL